MRLALAVILLLFVPWSIYADSIVPDEEGMLHLTLPMYDAFSPWIVAIPFEPQQPGWIVAIDASVAYGHSGLFMDYDWHGKLFVSPGNYWIQASVEGDIDGQDVAIPPELFPRGLTTPGPMDTINMANVMFRPDSHATVPEPSTLLLLASGLIGMGLWRRR